MMWVALSLLYLCSNSATLGTAYLPPPNAKDAGGHEDDLEVPLEPPYIDPYSDNRHLVPEVRYNFGYGTPKNESPDGIWDGLTEFGGRFLHGSYTYVGPDNEIVTVTYTGDRNKWKSRRKIYGDYSGGGLEHDDDDYDYFGTTGVLPTPPTLPWALRRAFAFHRKAFNKGNRRENKRGRQPNSEQPGEKSIIDGGYSFPKTETINHSVNNVQRASQNQNQN